MTPNTWAWQQRSGFIRSISRSWRGLASLQTSANAENLLRQLKIHVTQRQIQNMTDLHWKVDQNPIYSMYLVKAHRKCLNSKIANQSYIIGQSFDWPNIYFPQKYTNESSQSNNVISWIFKCTFDKNYRPLIFLNGAACTLSGRPNTLLARCTCW